jgi:hypothetical protein
MISRRSAYQPAKPKTGTEVPTSRVVVLKASAILNQRINSDSPVTMRDRFASDTEITDKQERRQP